MKTKPFNNVPLVNCLVMEIHARLNPDMRMWLEVRLDEAVPAVLLADIDEAVKDTIKDFIKEKGDNYEQEYKKCKTSLNNVDRVSQN